MFSNKPPDVWAAFLCNMRRLERRNCRNQAIKQACRSFAKVRVNECNGDLPTTTG
jgi:hypothetical protein